MSPSDQQLAALQQRYGQTQQLVDLLALQKLKQDKEAAARDMQMKMAQQQMAQGGLPTIKDQLESQVLGMTKQEVAQQVTDIAQQKQQQQQKALQQLAQSGIAQNPAPNMQFAGGGIVAFDDGGKVKNPYAFNPSEPGTSAATMKYRNAMENTFPSEAVDYLVAMGMDLVTALGKLGYDYDHYKKTGELKRKSETQGFFPRTSAVGTTREKERGVREAQIDQKVAADRAQFEKYLQQAPNLETPRAIGPEAMPYVSDKPTREALTRQNFEQMGIASQIPETKSPAQKEQSGIITTPKVEAGRSALTMPTQPAMSPQPAAPTAPTMTPMQEAAQEATLKFLGQDPEAARQKEYEFQQNERRLTPEQQAVYDQGIANARRRMEELSDPERMNREARIRGMLAAAGGGGFAAYGAGDLNAQEQQRLARKQAEEELMRTELGLVDLQRNITGEALKGREAESKTVSERQTKGVDAAARIAGDERTAATAAADRASRENIANLDRASRDYNEAVRAEISREQNKLQASLQGEIKRDAAYAAAVRSKNEVIAKRIDPIRDELRDIYKQLPPGVKLPPDTQARIDGLKRQEKDLMRQIDTEFDPIIDKYSPDGVSGFKLRGVRPSDKG